MWANDRTRPRFIDRIYLFSCESFDCWQNRTRQHYVTLFGRTVSYGGRKQTRTFENHDNLLAYLTNLPVYTPENGFRSIIKCQSCPFLSFAQAFFALIVRINCQNGVPLSTASCTVDYATMGVGTSTICLRSIKSSLPSLYPLCHSHDKIFQVLYRFSVLQATESWAGPRNEASGQLVSTL